MMMIHHDKFCLMMYPFFREAKSRCDEFFFSLENQETCLNNENLSEHSVLISHISINFNSRFNFNLNILLLLINFLNSIELNIQTNPSIIFPSLSSSPTSLVGTLNNVSKLHIKSHQIIQIDNIHHQNTRYNVTFFKIIFMFTNNGTYTNDNKIYL